MLIVDGAYVHHLILPVLDKHAVFRRRLTPNLSKKIQSRQGPLRSKT